MKTSCEELSVVRLAIVGIVLAAILPARADLAPLGEEDIARYESAFYHAGKNQWRDAEIWASRASDPVLVDVIRWMRLKDDWRAPFDDIQAFLETRAGWPSEDLLRRNAEEVDAGSAFWRRRDPPLLTLASPDGRGRPAPDRISPRDRSGNKGPCSRPRRLAPPHVRTIG